MKCYSKTFPCSSRLKVVFLFLAILHSFSMYSNGIKLAKSYHNNSSLQFHETAKCVESMSFQKNETLLDLGCGDGKVSNLLATKVPKGKVLGLDISKNMIDLARTLYKRDNLEFHVDDATFPNLTEQFDKLFSFYSFHWLANQDLALQSYNALLKPGGLFILQMPEKSTGRVSFACEKVAREGDWEKYFGDKRLCKNYLSIEELSQLLLENGFEILEINHFQDTGSFDSVKDFENWVLPLISCSDILPEPLRNLFNQQVIEEMKTHAEILPSGKVEKCYRIIQAIAMKKI